MRPFQTENIELAAFLAATGYQPTMELNARSNRTVFNFPEDDNLLNSIIAYEQGAALPAKHLLNTRAYLYREASRLTREARR